MAFDAGSVVARLGALFDERGFDQFDRAVAAADRKSANATLGAKVNRRAFDEFDAAVRAADKQRAEAALGAKIDDFAFKDFQARVAKADRAVATAKLKADIDARGFTEFAALSAAAGDDASALGKALGAVSRDASTAADAVGGGGGLTARVGALGGALGPVSAVLAAGAPIMLALAGAATALAGSLAAAAAGASAVGIGIGAALGPLAALGGAVVQRVSLMSDAFKALGVEQTKSGASAQAAAEQQHAAARQIETAEMGVADAHRATLRAQEDLTAARARAKREVEDLDAAVRHATLNESAAHLALREALKRLREVENDPKTSMLDIDEAQQAVDEARQGIEDTRRARQRAQQDAKRGSDTVRKAQEQVADAVRSEKRAVDQLAEARRSAGAAAAAQGAAASDAQQKMGALTKTEQQLVLTFKSTVDAFTKALAPATDAIFGGVNDALRRLTPLLGQFSGRFKGIGQDIGDVIRKAAGSLSGPEWTRAFDSFIKTSRQLVKPIANSVGSVMEILRDIAVAAQPFVVEFAKWMERALGNLADKTKDADRMSSIIGGLVEHTKAWARLTGDVARLLFTIFNSGARDGKSLVDILDGLVRKWTDFLSTKEGQEDLRRFFHDSIKLVTDLSIVIGKLTGAFYRASREISTALDGLVKAFSSAFDLIDGIITLDFAKAFRGLKGSAQIGFKLLIEFLKLQTKPMREAFSAIFSPLAGVAAAAWSGVTSVVRKGLDFLLGGVTTVQGAIESVVRIGSKLPFVGGQFKGLADDIKRGRAEIDRYRQSLRDTDEEHSRSSRGTGVLRDRVTELRGRLDRLRSGTQAYRETAADLRETQDRLNDKIAASRSTSDHASRGVGLLKGAITSARDAFDEAGASIARGYNSLADAFDVGKIVYKAASNSVKAPKAFAGGGIPNPGAGSGDDHMLLDPHGRPVALMSGTEGILNTPQMGIVDTALRIAASVGAMPFNGLADLWGSGMRHYAGGGILDRASALDKKHLPYLWGGGHGKSTPYTLADLVAAGGADCSGAVSYALGIAPRVSGGLTTIGKPGPGAVTIYANPVHTFMSIMGRGFGTSHENPGGGPGWLSYNSRPGFVVRHVGAGFGGTSDLVAPHIYGPDPTRTLLQRGVDRLAAGGRAKLTAAVGSIGGGQPLQEGRYDKGMLRGLWSKVGGNSGSSNLAAAVALAESGGDPNARNVNTNGTIDRGLWQINSIHGALSTFDPRGNAKSAVSISSNGRNWRPWVTYNTGAFRKFMSRGGALQRFAGGGMLSKPGSSSWWPTASYSGTVFQKRAVNTPDNNPSYARLSDEVSDLQRLYGQAERRYNQTDEILIDPDTGLVNAAEVRKRVSELDDLVTQAKLIWEKVLQKVAFARRIAASYAQTAAQLFASLKFAKKKDRSGIQAEATAYSQASSAWKREETLAGFDASDAQIFYEEQVQERNTVANTKSDPTLAKTSEPTETGGSYDTGGSSGGSSGATAQEIEAAAREMLRAFDSNRAELFGGYGGNFVSTDSRAIYDPTTGAAGFRYFGAVPSGGFSVTGPDGSPAAGSGGVTVVNNYEAPPPDPHTWVRGIEFELQSLTG